MKRSSAAAFETPANPWRDANGDMTPEFYLAAAVSGFPTRGCMGRMVTDQKLGNSFAPAAKGLARALRRAASQIPALRNLIK